MNDRSEAGALCESWRERIRGAAAAGTPLRIRGGGSKDFYGREDEGELLDTRPYAGVVNYEPTELVVTVRCGTPLAELEALLDAERQMLAFEPPRLGTGSTIGGCVAAGLSGPRRMSAGALRDFVLGVKMIDGRGERLGFGGQVMKNVAGYDISRVIAGSLGTLGLLLEVSLKVLPRPVAETTLRFELGQHEAIDRLNEWGGQPLPLSASAWEDGVLHLCLSGAEAAVRAAVLRLGGERVADEAAAGFWRALRDQQTPILAPGLDSGEALWRIAVPSAVPPLRLPGSELIECGGGVRWLRSDAAEAAVRERASALGGHATRYRGGDRRGEVFQPLSAPLLAIHRRLKAAFDPAGIFGRGRIYDGL